VLFMIFRKAKSHRARLLQQAISLEEIGFEGAGAPVADPIPLVPNEPRRPGPARGSLTEAFFEPLPADEFEAWQQ
jgi:hypothetical protein